MPNKQRDDIHSINRSSSINADELYKQAKQKKIKKIIKKPLSSLCWLLRRDMLLRNMKLDMRIFGAKE